MFDSLSLPILLLIFPGATAAVWMCGVISSIAAPLAEADVTLFMVVTQDSDYLMVKKTDLERTVLVLSQAGHRVGRQRR